MSRNAQYQFIPTDTESVVSDLTAMYEKFTGVTAQPAGPEMQFIRWVSNIVIQERVMNNYTGNQNIPSRAEGENLDALSELFLESTRPAAKAATCKMRFSISEAQDTAILIPAGTRVTDTGNTLVWETEEDAYIPIGDTELELSVRCQTTGTIGNGYAPGQINKLVDIYDYYSQCVNITESDGGSNVPDDDEFYELMRASMDGYSCAGARGGYIYFAKKVSTEIADVIATSPTPGVVKLYVLMNDGTLATEEMKAKVLAACNADEVRPLTDQVFVEDAEIVIYNVAFTYYIQTGSTGSAANIAAAVQSAVDEFNAWQCGKLGRDINPSRLINLLMQTGIKRVELTAPDFTVLRDGDDKTVPQIAAIGEVTIINGGYEDE